MARSLELLAQDAQAALNSTRDFLKECTSNTLTPTDVVTAATKDVEQAAKRLEVLKAAQASVVAARKAQSIPVQKHTKNEADLRAFAISTFNSIVMHSRDAGEMTDTAKAIVAMKAADPASTTNVSELVRTTYRTLMAELVTESIWPKLLPWAAATSLPALGSNEMIPYRDPAKGRFVLSPQREADSAPVSSIGYSSREVVAHRAAGILTFTNEIIDRVADFKTAIIDSAKVDIGLALDSLLLSDQPGSGLTPDGLLYSPHGSAATSQPRADVSAIAADLAAAGRDYRKAVLVMSTAQFLRMQSKLNAAGALAFPELSGASPRLGVMRVLHSAALPANHDAFVVSGQDLLLAAPALFISSSSDATLVMSSEQTRQHLMDQQPVRSLMQTNSSAVRVDVVYAADPRYRGTPAVTLVSGSNSKWGA